MKRPRHRVFDYPPRFYKPETDEKERRKRRLGFTRRTHISKKRSSIIWLILIIALIYIILRLKGIG